MNLRGSESDRFNGFHWDFMRVSWWLQRRFKAFQNAEKGFEDFQRGSRGFQIFSRPFNRGFHGISCFKSSQQVDLQQFTGGLKRVYEKFTSALGGFRRVSEGIPRARSFRAFQGISKRFGVFHLRVTRGLRKVWVKLTGVFVEFQKGFRAVRLMELQGRCPRSQWG